MKFPSSPFQPAGPRTSRRIRNVRDRLRRSVVLAACLTVASSGASFGAAGLDALYALLHERHVAFDTNVVAEAAVLGALRAIDPRAAILAAEEATCMDTGETVLKREEWAEGIGRGMTRNYRLRERFPPKQRTDDRFMHLFAMSIGAGK